MKRCPSCQIEIVDDSATGCKSCGFDFLNAPSTFAADGSSDEWKAKLTKKVRFFGFALVAVGLFFALIVPGLLRSEATAPHRNPSTGSGYWDQFNERAVFAPERMRHAAESVNQAQTLGWSLIIAGSVVLLLVRHTTMMDFVAKNIRP